MNRLLLVAGIFGFVGVGLGAFGAHALKDHLSEAMLADWRTGTWYHLIHAGMAALCGVTLAITDCKQIRIAGWLFLIGIVLFSGSLYVLALTGVKLLGAITPFGGLSFLAGWVYLSLAARYLKVAQPKTA